MRKIITSALVLALAAVLAPAMAAADGSVCPPGYGHHEFNGIDNCTAPGSVNGQYPWEAWQDYGQPQGDPQPGPEAEQPHGDPQPGPEAEQPVGDPQPGPEAEQPHGDPQPGPEIEQPVGDPQPQQQPQGDPLGTPEVEQAQPGQGVESGPEAQPQEQPAIVEVPQPVEVVPEQRQPQAQTAGGGCMAATIIWHKNEWDNSVGYHQMTGCVDQRIRTLIDDIEIANFVDGIANGWYGVQWYSVDHLGQVPEVECTPEWENTRTGYRAERYATGGVSCEHG